ncbi:MAG: AAA family ATPase [Filimonas sp.]|nr:AAA family ATPase [Filimonas sp.]
MEQIFKNKEWSVLEHTYEWVRDMAKVPQDALHHAEGNVAIHTQMVLAALEADATYQQMPTATKEILWTAGLMHDIEKRSTAVHEPDGRITSHGHARKGEMSVRQILYRDLQVPFAIREQIAALVRYHGLPLWILEKPDPLKALLLTSLRLDTTLLYCLAKADMEGRICTDKAGMLERVAFFKAYCEENDCVGKTKVFSNEQARFHYFNSDETYTDYVPFDDLKSEAIIMSGLPGMGKDHYIKQRYKDYPVISLDDIRRKHKLDPLDKAATGWVVQEAKEQARVYLRKGAPLVWNATNITAQMRSQLVALFASYKARVKIVYIETGYKEWIMQNKAREYALPQSALDKMLSKLEVPQLHEAHEVEYVIR